MRRKIPAKIMKVSVKLQSPLLFLKKKWSREVTYAAAKGEEEIEFVEGEEERGELVAEEVETGAGLIAVGWPEANEGVGCSSVGCKLGEGAKLDVKGGAGASICVPYPVRNCLRGSSQEVLRVLWSM